MSKIAIVGAGPAGCVAAVALRRMDPSLEVHVFEARDEHAWGDASDPRLFELWPNGLAALASIGIDREKLQGLPLERYDFRSRFGQLLSSLPVGAISRRQGHSTETIGAPMLRARLRAEAEIAQAKLFFDTRVAALELREDAVTVTVEGRHPGKVAYRMVIGADGARSAVRRLAAFPARSVRHYRLAAVSGLSTAAGSMVAPGVGFVAHGQDRRLGGWFYPHESGEAIASAWILFAPKGLFIDSDSGVERDPARLKARATEAVSGFGANLTQLVANTVEGRIRAHLLADAPLRKEDWTTGRVVLLGEAAHPILPDLGQGCAIAFEDAALLGRRLAGIDLSRYGAVTSALASWRDARHARVAAVVEQSRAANILSHLDGGFPDLRDLAIATSGEPTLTHGLEQLVSVPG